MTGSDQPIEPALGPLDVTRTIDIDPACGSFAVGKADRHASSRSRAANWARELRDQYDQLGVAFFVKQMTKKRQRFAGQTMLVRDFPLTGR